MNEELDLGNGIPVTGRVRKLKRPPPRLVTEARRSGFSGAYTTALTVRV